MILVIEVTDGGVRRHVRCEVADAGDGPAIEAAAAQVAAATTQLIRAVLLEREPAPAASDPVPDDPVQVGLLGDEGDL